MNTLLFLQNNPVFTFWIPVKMYGVTNLTYKLMLKFDLHTCEIILALFYIFLCVVLACLLPSDLSTPNAPVTAFSI